jgi:two-component system sensor histidine kinase UhpB
MDFKQHVYAILIPIINMFLCLLNAAKFTLMKKLIAIFLALVCGIIFSVHAQNQNKIDSLLEVLKTAKEDTNKAKVLINLSKLYYTNDPKKCFDYANLALSLAQKLNYSKCIIRSWQNIGIYYYTQGELERSLEYCRKALNAAEKTADKEAQCDVLNIMSSISSDMGNMSLSRNYSLKALALAEEIKDTARIVVMNTNLGIQYENESNYISALGYFLKALKINEVLHDKKSIANNYFQIGRIYVLEERDTDKALKYSLLSLKFAKEADDQLQVANSLDLLGVIYKEMKDWDKSLNYFQEALNKYQSTDNINQITKTNFNIGELFREQGKFDKSIEYYNTALESGNKIGIVDELGASYYGLGLAYQGKKNYTQAIYYLKKSQSYGEAQTSPAHVRNVLQSLANNYSLSHDFKSAYDYLIEYNRVNDSIVNKEIIGKTNEMHEKYESEKKEKEIILLNKDNELQNAEIKKQTLLKNSFIGGLALMCVLVFLGYRSYRTRQLLKLQTLRNKIASDLHDDVGSTLSSIAIFSEVAQQQSKEVIPMLNTIGESARKMLDAMADIVWTINPENDQFEKIILRMRSFAYELLGAKKIEFEFTADDDITKKKLPMSVRKNLYLIFKEATNNLAKYSDATKVSFTIKDDKNKLNMLIRDNGKGFDITKEVIGNGLKNMRKRADEIGATLLIDSLPGGGTSINLLIDIA